jgi:hypothetical protein
MGFVSWQASVTGHYWIDVAVGNQDLRWMVDTGLVDPLNRVGFDLEPSVYDQLKVSGQFQRIQYRNYHDASGGLVQRESGLITAQLIDPHSHQRLGPVVATFVARGFPGVPSRVGLVFFHGLKGCRVIWNLERKTWDIEYP